MSNGDFGDYHWTSDLGAVSPSEAERRRSLSLSADFYREPDDVVRGMAVGHGSAFEGMGGDAHKGLLDGDYYTGHDHVIKGVAMAAPGAGGTAGPGTGTQAEVHSVFGKQTHRPPPVPKDPYFQLRITTIQLKRDSPCEIADELHEFFRNKVKASIKCTNANRCRVKADVFIDYHMCTLKARVYDMGNDIYAIEFERRSGDCIVFNETYHSAVTYFQPLGLVALGPHLQGGPPLPGPLVKHASGGGSLLLEASLGKGEEPELGPLLDLAECPGLQAEAASALARSLGCAGAGAGAGAGADAGAAAAGGGATPLVPQGLATARACEQLRDLLKGQVGAAYPAGCVVAHLAACPEAASCLAENGLLTAIGEQLRSEATNFLVRQELKTALAVATGTVNSKF